MGHTLACVTRTHHLLILPRFLPLFPFATLPLRGYPPSLADISSTFALPSTPSLSRGSLSGRPSLSQPLTPAGSLLLPGRQSVRASCGSISRLVRDSATGAIVQQLGAGSSGAGGGPGASRLGASVVQGVAAAVEPEAPNWDDSLLMDGFVPPKVRVAPGFSTGWFGLPVCLLYRPCPPLTCCHCAAL